MGITLSQGCLYSLIWEAASVYTKFLYVFRSILELCVLYIFTCGMTSSLTTWLFIVLTLLDISACLFSLINSGK